MDWRKVAAAAWIVGSTVSIMACSSDNGAGPDDDNVAPQAEITAIPDSGFAPLTVWFFGGGSDADGRIAKIEFDFDGDGVFDHTKIVNPLTDVDSTDNSTETSVEHRYDRAGTYMATVRVTDDGGTTDTASKRVTVQAPAYEGFHGLPLQTGKYWEYSWARTDARNLDSGRLTSGTVRITLGFSLMLTNGLILFQAIVTQSGDAFPLSLPLGPYGFVGVLDDVIYKARTTDGGLSYQYWQVFDPLRGTIGQSGLMDYFRGDVQEAIYSGSISNRFGTRSGVTVRELWDKPFCETISGVRICGTEAWAYETEEYYLPGIGFGGFYRSGTYSWSSPFPGGSASSTILLMLTSTNM